MAEARFHQARTMVRYSRAAEFPTIGVDPGIQSLRYSPNEPYFPANVGTGARSAFTLPFDLSYEVDLWGRIRRTVTSAAEEAQATAADLETAALSLHAELAIDYFELRSSDAEQKLLDDYYAFKGWNREGIPTRQTLEQLGLGYVADDLEERGILTAGEGVPAETEMAV